MAKKKLRESYREGKPGMKKVSGEDGDVKPSGNTGVKPLKAKKFKAKKKARGE